MSQHLKPDAKTKTNSEKINSDPQTEKLELLESSHQGSSNVQPP